MTQLVRVRSPRFQSPYTCAMVDPAPLKDAVSSARLRKRSSLLATTTSPVAVKTL